MSLLLTRTQNIREKSEAFYKNEYRSSQVGCFDAFKEQGNSSTPLLKKKLKDQALKSVGSTIETPVINYDSGVAIGNTREVIIADSENTSQMYQFTFTTYSWGFTIIPSLFMNNEIDMQADFEAKFKKYLIAFSKTLDTAALASLETAKTQVFADSLDYTVTSNVVQSPLANKDVILGDSEIMQWANDYQNGPYHIVGNGGIKQIVKQLSKDGLYNQTNQRIEYDNKILHYSNRLVNDAGEAGLFYCIAPDNLDLLFRVEREAILGTKMKDGTEWAMDRLPMLDIPVGTYFYESKGDFNTIAGAASADMTRNYKQHFGWSVDVCFVTAYNSDETTIASPILKAASLTT